MRKSNRQVFYCMMGLIAGVISCGERSGNGSTGHSEASSRDVKTEKGVSSHGGDSELTLFMRAVEEDMKTAKEDVKSGRGFNDTLHFEFESIGHYKASPHVAQDEKQYEVFTEDLITKTSQFLKADTADRIVEYNTVVNSCISCHEMYCPGPIVRIKKLRIKE